MANNEEISQVDEVASENTTEVENQVQEQPSTKNTEANADTKGGKAEKDVSKLEKADKSKTDKKAKKSKDKKPNKIAKSLKETGSELKKVTWPKFGTVVKQTGVVLLVTALFLLVVFGIDRLCSWLVDFIV